MLAVISDFFINLCIIIALLFIYLQIRWKLNWQDKPYFQLSIIDGAVGGLMGFILMNFSIEVLGDTLVDLRFIPVLLVVMFIGPYPAVISTILIILGRFTLGMTTSSVASLILMIALVTGFILINRWYEPNQQSYKKALLMILYSNLIFTIIMSALIQDGMLLAQFMPVYWIVSFICGWTAVFFMKYIQQTQYLLMKYEQESATDFLTGLNNVRQFAALWNRLASHARENGEQLSLLVLDVDYFKQVNDTYGHAAGNYILTELGVIFKNATRSLDVVSRNGGEEFSIILPNCPHQQALATAELIRSNVESHSFAISSAFSIKITISIGVATYPDTVNDPVRIVRMADECLYQAKHLGRNRVCDRVES
ncbi:GGDEF domain-containing protein [Gracilibacillus timonensis]|uniref:GGDEF domain-containing protein n=1 Tax=Gracilibacillus timonensis TaxID=1816696 RepID=UPI000825EF0D|nr:diguanylate cyclase [Gracilibacillus timonensis]